MTAVTRASEEHDDDDQRAAGPPVGKKHLLLIAIDDYSFVKGYNDLCYPVKDAQKFALLLGTEYAFDNIITAYDKEANAKTIKEKILDLKGAIDCTKDQLVVFFAGHGAFTDNNGYWITHDGSQRTELNLAVSEILLLLAGCCPQILVIADCCFSGTTIEKAFQLAQVSTKGGAGCQLYVVASGTRTETVPDKSVFMESLLEVLQRRSISSMDGLMSHLYEIADQQGMPRPTRSYGNDQTRMPFVLQRKDKVSYELANSFFNLNYRDQIREINGALFFNMIYLRGDTASGHHIFTQRFFKEMGKEAISMFNHPPYPISFGSEVQSPDYSIWGQLAAIFGSAVSDPTTVIRLLLNEVAAKNLLLIGRIHQGCDPGKLGQVLEDFWKDMAGYLDSHAGDIEQYTNAIYLFLWDLRGSSDDLEDILTTEVSEKIPNNEAAVLFPLPVVTELKKVDFTSWRTWIKQSNGSLGKDGHFMQLNFDVLTPPLSMENVICQIAQKMQRNEVFTNLFNKKNTWPK